MRRRECSRGSKGPALGHGQEASVTVDQTFELLAAACVAIFLAYSLIHLVHLWRSGRGRHPIKALREQPGFTEVVRTGLYRCDSCGELVEFREQHLHRCPATVLESPYDWSAENPDVSKAS
jgi:hypothetical protein